MVESLNQRRVKAVTPIVTGALLAALLLHNWGEGTVFSGIRPAVKSTLNRVFDVKTTEPNQDTQPKPK